MHRCIADRDTDSEVHARYRSIVSRPDISVHSHSQWAAITCATAVSSEAAVRYLGNRRESRWDHGDGMHTDSIQIHGPRACNRTVDTNSVGATHLVASQQSCTECTRSGCMRQTTSGARAGRMNPCGDGTASIRVRVCLLGSGSEGPGADVPPPQTLCGAMPVPAATVPRPPGAEDPGPSLLLSRGSRLRLDGLREGGRSIYEGAARWLREHPEAGGVRGATGRPP